MAKSKKHYRKSFYTSPCYINGCPPKMIRTSDFCNRFNYSIAELQTLMRDKHVLAATFKKWLVVCPNACSWIWEEKILIEFWGNDYLKKIG